ncbi:hypothetical protein SLA2020_057360 [Shorea laevis]
MKLRTKHTSTISAPTRPVSPETALINQISTAFSPPSPPTPRPLAPMGSITRPLGKTPIGSTVSSSAAATFQPLLVKIASRLPPEM